MIRKNIQITEEQEELLKRKAFENRTSEAEIIREALDLYFKNQKGGIKMFIHEVQSKVQNVVTEISRQYFKRMRRDRTVELEIFNIKENYYEFKAEQNFDKELVRSYKLNGEHFVHTLNKNKPEYIEFKLSLIIEQDEEAKIATYNVSICDGTVICEPDDHENNINDVEVKELKFSL